jgi:hypothetical protein
VAHAQEGLGEHRQEGQKTEARHATTERPTGQPGASACGTGSHLARRCTKKTRFYRIFLKTGKLIVARHELSRTGLADFASQARWRQSQTWGSLVHYVPSCRLKGKLYDQSVCP